MINPPFPSSDPKCPPSHLRDESRFQGVQAELKTPADHRALAELAVKSLERGQPMTFQGARTGLCGGCVPLAGQAVSLTLLDRPISLEETPEGFELRVQPGYDLASLGRDLSRRRFDFISAKVKAETLSAFRSRPYFWPPDPGERTATIGGLASTRAAGPGAHRYGSVAEHIAGLNFLMADGQERSVRRGRHFFRNGRMLLPGGQELAVDPSRLGLSEEADLLDLLIGSQGMYGLITSLDLKLAPAPAHVWALVFFLDSEEKAAALADVFLAEPLSPLVSLDYLDEASLKMVLSLRKTASKLLEIPPPPLGAAAAVLLEFHSNDESEIESAAAKALAGCQKVGGDPDQSWALTDAEAEKMRIVRHAVPEGLGGRLDQIRAKGYPVFNVASDFTRPGPSLTRCLAEYRRDLKAQNLEAVIFGHAKDNNLHVNILTENVSQTKRALELMADWLGRARETGGKLFQEHGVGKLKRELFAQAEKKETVDAWRTVKKTLDPHALFNPQNMLAD
ncbi:MAG: FAD-binding oxidoreductase [Deltaproteobacteria bacterium]|jgi:D-lactate dehydrogenase (cytochrome)|nr:FAD-binding oxidoreductase [Deltaproteobacteria bacterium]